MNKKTRVCLAILCIMLMTVLSVPAAFAAGTTVDVITNGAGGDGSGGGSGGGGGGGGTPSYSAGSVVVISGQVLNNGSPLPGGNVSIQVKNPSNMVVFYADMQTDSNGYYRAIFALPVSSFTGQYTINVNSMDASGSTYFTVTASGKQGPSLLGWSPQGLTLDAPTQTIPLDTRKIVLVFSKNVNYFYNSSHPGYEIGVNENNQDSIKIFKGASNTPVSFQMQLISSDAQSSAEVSYYDISEGISSTEGKRATILNLSEDLTPETSYKVVVSKDLCANNGIKLGQDTTVYFKTAAKATTTVTPPTTDGGGGGGTPAQNISTVKSSAGKEEITVDPTKVLSAMQKGEPLVIDLSTLAGADNKEIVVNIPQEVIAEAQRQNQDIVLNGPGYSIVIPAGALPANQAFSLSIQQVGGTGLPATPTTLNQMTVYEYNVGEGCSHNFNQALTLSFPVPQGTVNPELLSVYFLNETTGQWEYVGGRIVNGRLTAETKHLSKYMVAESTKTFADIADHWAKNTIEVMVARQVISGISDSEFAPDRQITRAEFACLLTRALHQEKDLSDSGFSDVNMNDWYAGYVSRAAKLGLVCGYDGKFNPDATITRQEMACMIMSAYKYSGGKLDALADLTFVDKDSVSVWAVDSVKGAYKLGIINGRGQGLFAPQANASRAEAAVMLKSLMDKVQK